MNRLALVLGAAASLAGAAPALAAPQPEEARIPFLHPGQVRTFDPVDHETVYIQTQRRIWYRVTTAGYCASLPWARDIGVDVRGGATIDRFSTLLVDGDRCAIGSVVRSDAPPPRRERRIRG